MKLIEDLEAALRRLGKRPKRPAPATADQIARLEAELGRPLPPSYRQLLAVCSGFKDGADPLVIGMFSVAEMSPTSKTQREAREWQRAAPDRAEAIRGIVFGQALDSYALFDPDARPGLAQRGRRSARRRDRRT